MLKHPTLDKLHALKLTGMAAALADQSVTPDITELSFEERLGLLVDREMTERENRRMTSRLRRAKLRHTAILEDIDYRNSRGLDKGLIQSLSACQWVKEHLNVLITGPTGVGKTWLACALDDWGLVKLSAENRRDLLEVLEDRHGRRSTIATSQLPIEEWHGVIGDATLADAILDRLVHNAYKINLRGESMRKRQAKLTDTASSE